MGVLDRLDWEFHRPGDTAEFEGFTYMLVPAAPEPHGHRTPLQPSPGPGSGEEDAAGVEPAVAKGLQQFLRALRSGDDLADEEEASGPEQARTTMSSDLEKRFKAFRRQLQEAGLIDQDPGTLKEVGPDAARALDHYLVLDGKTYRPTRGDWTELGLTERPRLGDQIMLDGTTYWLVPPPEERPAPLSAEGAATPGLDAQEVARRRHARERLAAMEASFAEGPTERRDADLADQAVADSITIGGTTYGLVRDGVWSDMIARFETSLSWTVNDAMLAPVTDMGANASARSAPALALVRTGLGPVERFGGVVLEGRPADATGGLGTFWAFPNYTETQAVAANEDAIVAAFSKTAVGRAHQLLDMYLYMGPPVEIDGPIADDDIVDIGDLRGEIDFSVLTNLHRPDGAVARVVRERAPDLVAHLGARDDSLIAELERALQPTSGPLDTLPEVYRAIGPPPHGFSLRHEHVTGPVYPFVETDAPQPPRQPSRYVVAFNPDNQTHMRYFLKACERYPGLVRIAGASPPPPTLGF